MASALEFSPRRISVAEYHKMIEASVFGDDERIELLTGPFRPSAPASR